VPSASAGRRPLPIAAETPLANMSNISAKVIPRNPHIINLYMNPTGFLNSPDDIKIASISPMDASMDTFTNPIR
jgi:hypothetical protein